MKKLNPIILMGFLCLICIACGKKGENDPFMSLKTRNSRITGHWDMVKLESTSSVDWQGEGIDEVSTIVSTMENGIYTIQYPDTTYIYDYAYSVKFNKDGTCLSNVTVDEIVVEEKYEWWWMDSAKKKTGIWFNGLNRIDRLTNKELILTGDFYLDYLDPEASLDYYSDYSFRIVFEKDKKK